MPDFQGLNQLIQEHLEASLDGWTGQGQPPIAPTGLPLEPTIQIVLEALRADGDVLIAELLAAALQLRQAVPEDEAEFVNEFLERVTATLTNEGLKVRGDLENLLLRLSRKAYFGLAQQPASPAPVTPGHSHASAEHGIIISIGTATYSVPFGKVLTTFWGSELDTDCHACQQPIADEPPIRTISRVNPGLGDANAASSTHVRIHNRHFSCLQSRPDNSPWVPVSHVWEDCIRRANEAKTHDDEAASTLIRTLTTLLNASVDAYEPGVEFWHDYFCVPQWRGDVKDALLLRIPAIYHGAQEILVQMPDLPGPYIMSLVPDFPTNWTPETVLRYMPVLFTLCSSQWMERMWVLLEYSLCRSACVMDQSGYIWRSPDGAGAAQRDTFTTLVRNGHTALTHTFRYAKSFASSLKDGFLAGLTDRRQDTQRPLTLGESLELIARTKCHLFRDRFVAIFILLNGRDPQRVAGSPAIPRDAVEACKWVWRSALSRQDFSPLLLQPRESHPESNPEATPSWSVGYCGLDGAEWDLGDQKAPGAFSMAVREADGVIQTELDLVGKIEHIHHLDVEESGEVAGVEWAIGILLSIAKSADKDLTAADLVDGLNRIFPFDIIHTKLAELQAGIRYSLEERRDQDRSFAVRIERYVAEYSAAPAGEAGNPQRRYAAQRVMRLMKYLTHIAGNISSEITRLTKSRHISRGRRERGAAGGEPICEVKCPGSQCQTRTVLRLDLRTTAAVGDEVYRIPGLSYAEGTEDGIGLVLSAKSRITGRMRFGPPTCGCTLRHRVDIR